MYRQIQVMERHWPYQKLLWRFEPSENVETYVLTVVAFGVKSSPYLAIRVVQELLAQEREAFPLAVEFVSIDLYMDDLVSSVESESTALGLSRESVNFFAAGGFTLTKFATNSVELLKTIPLDKRLNKDVAFESDTKILGINWNSESDTFFFKLEIPEEECTKRIILSTIARCYDPIGLIAPFILFLKLLMQQLWHLNLDWDVELPQTICGIWKTIRQE